MKKIFFVITTFVLVATIAGTFYTTKYYIYKSAYSAGENAGFKLGYLKGSNRGPETTYTGNCPTYDPFHIYVNCSSVTSVPQVQRAPSYCSSYSYGIKNQFTDTTCY